METGRERVEDVLVAAVAVIRRWGASHNRDVDAPRWLGAMLEALVAADVLERAASVVPGPHERWADPVASALEEIGALPEDPPGRRSDCDLLTPAPGFRLGAPLIAPGEEPRVLIPDTQPDGAIVLCVACFAHCFLVHGITRPVAASRGVHWMAEDDLGTRYPARSGAGGCVNDRTIFAYLFGGGVPAEASTLTITLAARGTIHVDVRR